MKYAEKMLIGLVIFSISLMFATSVSAEMQEADGTYKAIQSFGAEESENVTIAKAQQLGLIALGGGIAVGVAGLATGWAEKEIGSATVGAIAENEKLFGKGITLMVLPETIVLFGFAIAFLILNM